MDAITANCKVRAAKKNIFAQTPPIDCFPSQGESTENAISLVGRPREYDVDWVSLAPLVFCDEDTGSVLTRRRHRTISSSGTELRLVVESDALVVFGDGLESDRLVASWGQTAHVDISPRRLRLVIPA